LAVEVCQAAEQYRKDLAFEWLGSELPPWRGPCPITVRLASGAGGATSFMFDNGVPFGWTMNIQGPRERILDSVLPHEITHTIFATHFGRPLPRWCDEGACTTVEHASERAKQDRFLIEFLHTDRGIPFNQMFRMTEYPDPILPLYSQGYSLTRYLIQQGGKRKFVNYIGEGMATRNWPAATQKHYGFADLSELQVTWLEWVRQGSPNLKENGDTALASAAVPEEQREQSAPDEQPSAAEAFAMARQNSAYGWQAPPAQNARTFAAAESFVPPPAPTNFPAETAAPREQVDASSVSRPVSDGWYARKRDQAQAIKQDSPATPPATRPTTIQAEPRIAPPPTRSAVPGNRRVLMEWRKDAAPPASSRTEVTGLVLNDDGRLQR
jgi:hypothetical protein